MKWPFVSAKRYAAELAAANARVEAVERNLADQRIAMERRHAAELAERTKQVTAILEKLSDCRFRPNEGGRYALEFSFDPRVICYGSMPPDQLSFVAQELGDRVRHEVETAKFIVPRERTRQ